MKTNVDSKDLIHPKAWDKLQAATLQHKRIKDNEAGMAQLEKTLKEFKDPSTQSSLNGWSLDLFINGRGTLRIHPGYTDYADNIDDSVKVKIEKAIEQFLTLLESIHYSEMMDAVKQLNKILEEPKHE